jgi:hypothetical protein
VPNSDEAYPIVKEKLGYSVSRDQVRLIAKEEKFETTRLKRGQRHKNKAARPPRI